jgi:NAD(P)-dependent dehydrogenase (short-subunit alcohol dehydrogenase family)
MLERAMLDLAEKRGIPLDAVVEEFQADSPQKQFQEPTDVADAVLFLASDESARITGTQLVVDGGSTLSQG